jgi:hypothetical protein
MDAEIKEGMDEKDFICVKCDRKINPNNYDEKGHLTSEKLNWALTKYNQQKEAAKQSLTDETDEMRKMRKEELSNLLTRGQEYKKTWNKNGIIQFKNERIAILSRMFGSQVEFIVAYDDLTKEGYRLMAIDEGKEGGTGNLMGGVNSYYYFQKTEFVR